jgi:sugar phosphate isomerase/epimerase/nucleoside-diphosphate-sugar epimerase
MSKILIGSTGLVGKTLKDYINFDYEFNSKNMDKFIVDDSEDCELYLSCLPATKWMVNQDLQKDILNIKNILHTISKFRYKKIILISTIDVYNFSPLMSDETYGINFDKLSYGTNRYLFELLVEEMVESDDLKIFRLPALFNKNIKKNILFDLINNNNVEQINTNSKYQWYNLDSLANDIDYYSNNYSDRKIFNLFNEPIETSEIVDIFPNMKNKVSFNTNNRIEYNYKTNLSESGYIKSSEEVLENIKKLYMNLAISNLAWDKENEHSVFKEINRLGINRIEGVIGKVFKWEEINTEKLKIYADYLKNNNIEIKSIQSIMYGIGIKSFHEEEKMIKHFERLIYISKFLDIDKLVLGSPKMRIDRNIENIFKKIDKMLKDTNINIVIEPNAGIYGGSFFTKVPEIVNFIEQNSLENIKTMIDTHNSILEGECPVEAFHKYSNYIKHIHVSEVGLKSFSVSDIHKDFSNELKSKKYENIITYESLNDENIIKSIEYFTEVYM